jgi:hypothetical protein
MKVEKYLLSLSLFEERDHGLYTDEDHIRAEATLCLTDMSRDDWRRFRLFIHPELHIESVVMPQLGIQLGFETSLFPTQFSIHGLLREVHLTIPSSAMEQQRAELAVRYRGWVHCCGIEDNSNRFIGIRDHQVILRSLLSTLWFPCPYWDREGVKGASDFEVTITAPAELRCVLFGNRVCEEISSGKRVSRWKTLAPVAPYEPMLWADAWKVLESPEISVYHHGSPESKEASERYVSVCSQLLAFFDRQYGALGSEPARYHIVELDVQAGGWASQRTLGFPRNQFCRILDEHARFGMLEWIGHEMVHEYVNTPFDPEAPGAAVVYDGFALFFHVAALISVLGEEFRKWVLRRAWESYENGLAGGSDGEGTVPPDKPLAEITTVEYFEKYKDRFPIVDKLRIVLYHLKEIIGDAAFYAAVRRYLEDHRVRPAVISAFEASLEAASNRDLSDFFHRWFRTTDRLLQAWKQSDLG